MVLLAILLFTGVISLANSLEVQNHGEFALDQNYNVMYFSEQLDHMNRDSGLINIRVLFLQGQINGPLFVYCGGNEPLEYYYNNAGWITTYLAPTYNASVAFIEHRYYGDSVPNTQNYYYLTTSQALYDFADIVEKLKPITNTAVITFGGVYSGMLAAFFRIKYPHIVDGAIASSAPFLAQLDTNGTGYARTVTKDYFDVNPFCSVNILDSFNILDNIVSRPNLYQAVETTFHTCQSI
jgi:lysosomal Pro-X carboxypeptidase